MLAKRESELYPFIVRWFSSYLQDRFPHDTVLVLDSSRKSLSRLIRERGLFAGLPDEWPSWDIHVDIVGFVSTQRRKYLSFVECKVNALNLDHMSQLLGYSRVANPLHSFLISPEGVSDSLRSLLVTYGRLDVLDYSNSPGHLPRSIKVARWDHGAEAIDVGSMITGDQTTVD